jgi:hypothetical protein
VCEVALAPSTPCPSCAHAANCLLPQEQLLLPWASSNLHLLRWLPRVVANPLCAHHRLKMLIRSVSGDSNTIWYSAPNHYLSQPRLLTRPGLIPPRSSATALANTRATMPMALNTTGSAQRCPRPAYFTQVGPKW